MHSSAALIVAAARGCLGTRFRAQGRTPGLALDCVGVVLVAARAIGLAIDVPAYSLAGDLEAGVDSFLRGVGCTLLDRASAGDLLTVAPAPGRRHLAVVTECGVVHAHAGLGRVVEAPVDPAWTVLAAWRLPEGD